MQISPEKANPKKLFSHVKFKNLSNIKSDKIESEACRTSFNSGVHRKSVKFETNKKNDTSPDFLQSSWIGNSIQAFSAKINSGVREIKLLNSGILEQMNLLEN